MIFALAIIAGILASIAATLRDFKKILERIADASEQQNRLLKEIHKIETKPEGG